VNIGNITYTDVHANVHRLSHYGITAGARRARCEHCWRYRLIENEAKYSKKSPQISRQRNDKCKPRRNSHKSLVYYPLCRYYGGF